MRISDWSSDVCSSDLVARQLVHDWRSHLGRDGSAALVLDGYDSGVPPQAEDLRETVGIDLAGILPLDWRQRLLSINSGQPIQEQAPRSEERRVGKECVRTFSSRWAQVH